MRQLGHVKGLAQGHSDTKGLGFEVKQMRFFFSAYFHDSFIPTLGLRVTFLYTGSNALKSRT